MDRIIGTLCQISLCGIFRASLLVAALLAVSAAVRIAPMFERYLSIPAFFWLMIASWREASGVRRSASPTLRALGTGFQLMWVALMVIYVVRGNFLGNPKTNLTVWGIMGLVSAARRLYRSRAGA